MHSHGDLILKLFAKSRGKAAEYWGEKYLQNDQMVHTLGFPELGATWFKNQNPQLKAYITSFVEGMNAYAKAHPDRLAEDKKVALPIENEDVLKHYLFVVYTRFVGGSDLSRIKNWTERGSNTYAVHASRSASGNAMLVQNPHLPWFDEWLFYEGHLNMPGMNTYGATLVGLPTLGIAFNEHLGWSHTNNTIDNADLYELTLKGNKYVLDGEEKAFEVRQKTLKVKQKDGSIKDMPLPIRKSAHGPIISQKEGKALAIRMPGYDQYDAALQWWEMGTATNFEEFEAAIKKVQIPFFNIMYADKKGDIFYMFNGQVPKRSSGDWGFWSGIVPGDKSEYIWNEVHSYEELPKVKNPASGWLQNANDPPWTSTFPMALKPTDYPPYMAPIRMNFRPQRSARMLAEDESITYNELVSYKLSTRWEMADRLLDDLFSAIDQYGAAPAKKAKSVLEKWDRASNVDSKGAVLFYLWAYQVKARKPSTYAQKWELSKARTTPDGLADPEKAVKVLEAVVAEMEKNYGGIDIPWGDFYRIKYNDMDLPANGADGGVGVYRVAWTNGLEKDGKMYVNGGDTWVNVIEFGDKIKASALMSYGNSTQPNSPHFGDQLKLFSKNELRAVYFYKEDVEKHIMRTEIKAGNTMVER
jgi:acyl-homoserine-lactone acylase